ncbi:hypothetical protein KAFR_0L02030 [Kazachstania africana CBS 2517]|uniref:D-arabinono-1,4-lactone oxidase n=1 Tax=Kazachstania africana (strain ATCC 22294 / BCRC 22015 / CBS 2517 / CECT 1963 / NBRC 1671 / NRRL Y-8276) TaxID=1071382 RepID=H2B2G4_KAZAF|nr:hypothetical protein KAFR_0L02030 [Kazachstania africana CBS 2517]CCF60814.1 hypothetical protein KAFR_0L02030 [Kazachstania africana CBS 2517]
MSSQDMSCPTSTNFVLTNWAKIYHTNPELYFQPRNVDELRGIVRKANESGKTITVVGGANSPNDICKTEEWLISLDKMKKVNNFEMSKDKTYADVTVEAGITLEELNDYCFKKYDYVLQNLASIACQSVAGAISTGTHGSSPYHGLLSSQIVNLTIVNGEGKVLFLDSKNNADVFRASLLSLGKIGIIYNATVRVVPSFNIKSTKEIISFDYLIEKWDTLWTSAEFVRVWWYPYTRKCVLWRGTKTEEHIKERPKGFLGNKFGRLAYESLLWISCALYRPFTPILERFIFRILYGNVGGIGEGSVEVLPSFEGLTMDCLFAQYVDEWAAKLNDGPGLLRSLDNSISKAAKDREFYVHVPMEIRCSNTLLPKKQQNISGRSATSPGPIYGNLISPYLDISFHETAYVPPSEVTNSQLNLFINATIYRPFSYNTPIFNWFRSFENAMSHIGGRPHWAKNFLGPTNLAVQDAPNKEVANKYTRVSFMRGRFQDWYGKDLIQFDEIRRKQDPKNVLLRKNDWAVQNGILEG